MGTDDCLQPTSFLVKYSDFDVVEDKYMAISLNYRGAIKSKVANATVQWVKTQGKVSFVEWCPTGFKIGLNDVPAATVKNDDMAPSERNATMIGNNIAVNRVLRAPEQEVRHDVLPESLRPLVRRRGYGRR